MRALSASAILVTCLSAGPALGADDIGFNVEVKAACASPSSDKIQFEFPVSLPNELDFLVGTEGGIHHQAASIDEIIYGANSNTSLLVKSEKIDLTSGFVKNSIYVRLGVNEKEFCDHKHRINLTYELFDSEGTILPKVRFSLVPGMQTNTVLTDAGKHTVLQAISQKYADRFEFFMSEDFFWYDNHKKLEKEPQNLTYRKLDFCAQCGRIADLVMTRALGKFLASVDSRLIISKSDSSRVLLTWSKDMQFVRNKNGQVTLRLFYSSDSYLDFGTNLSRPADERRNIDVVQVVLEKAVLSDDERLLH